MEPGSDAAYRARLDPELIYRNEGERHLYHGSRPKRNLEGPQICTGRRVAAVDHSRTGFRGHPATIHLPHGGPRQKNRLRMDATARLSGGQAVLLSMDKIDAVNSSDAMFLRIDMPGHVRHTQGDTFSEIYLSYRGRIPAAEFLRDFPPDERFDYRRDRDPLPQRSFAATGCATRPRERTAPGWPE